MQNTLEKKDEFHPILEGYTHSSLGRVIEKAKKLLALDRHLQTILPTELAAFCHVMNVNQGILILGVSSAAIAMRIRFMSSDLVRALQKNAEWQMIREIQCKVCAKS